jgi:hypothetical protein
MAITAPAHYVYFTPFNRSHSKPIGRQMRRSKERPYSIISSARMIRSSGPSSQVPASFQVDDEFELSGLLEWQVGGLFAQLA